ncbi:MAG: SpoIIIAC/SpoIIIAD family protein [Eubacteriales bacterium]|jgi:stage III sporulation protein AD
MMMKICGGALLVAFVTLLIRQLKPEMTMPVTVTGAVILLLAAVGMLAPQIEYINGLWYAEELRGYATPLVKSLGVALVAQTASDLCRDMGENSAASKVEFAGKLEIMLICLPLIDKLLEFARGLLLG